MTSRTRRAERRTDALSKERIVEAAREILDDEGENALTFRALAARLATGSGAIYHHVAGKDQLLTAAANDVVARAVTDAGEHADPRKAIRAITLSVFDAIDAHPWVGTQLAREPWQSPMARIFESVGTQLEALGVAENDQFYCASALVNYILGVAGQYAAAARALPRNTDRSAFLATVAEQWTENAPGEHSFLQRMATRLSEHDEREQFLTGIDLFLAGLAARR